MATKDALGPKQLVRVHEEYDDSIKNQVTLIENSFKDYIQQKLNGIYVKIINSLLPTFLKLQKAQQISLGDIFDKEDFNIDLKQITPLIVIGTNFQRNQINNRLTSMGSNTSRVQNVFGVNFNPEYTRYVDLISQRKAFLDKTLEQTTFQKLTGIVSTGINDGLTYKEVADKVKSDMGFNGSRAELIARTESNWALNEGQRRYMDTLGVKQFQVSLASSACDLCIDETNKGRRIYSINEKNIVPIHPNCRCTLISIIPREWIGDNYIEQTGPQYPHLQHIVSGYTGNTIENYIGDMEGLEEWKGDDELMKLYHGGEGTTIMPNGKTSQEMIDEYGLVSGKINMYGKAVYTTTEYEDAKKYGNNVYEVYIKPKKLRLFNADTDDMNQVIALRDKAKKQLKDQYYTQQDQIMRQIQLIRGDSNEDFAQKEKLYTKLEELEKESQINISEEGLVAKAIAMLGYDGVYVPGQNYYAIFDQTPKFIRTR